MRPLVSMGADTSPPGGYTVTTEQRWLYLDGVLSVSILRGIDGAEDNHVLELNEINDFPLGFAVALDVPLGRLDTVMPD